MDPGGSDRLAHLRQERQASVAAGESPPPLVAGPDHALLARAVAADLRALARAAGDLADLVASWQREAVLCGLFDDLEETERPDADWRARIEQALAFVDEATA